MKLASIRIENLRSFSDATISFDDYTCLVGANGSGKSTVLTALNVFFRETVNAATDCLNLDREDFFCGRTDKPVKVTVTFENLSAEAQDDFAAYYRHGKLVISAVAEWNEAKQCAEVRQYGERLGVRAFEPFLKAARENQAVKTVLKPMYEGIQKKYPELPAWKSAPQAVQEVEAYAESHQDQCELLPSETKFYGYTAGAHYLQKYVQWVYVPAVKDAASEQTEGRQSSLSKLLERTVLGKVTFDKDFETLLASLQGEYDRIVSANQVHLRPLSDSLAKRLRQWAHPDARMRVEYRANGKALQVARPVAQMIAGEGPFEGSIARFGHGLQRSFLLAVLQELAADDSTGGPKLILGIEEPELYQHPPQARHLASVLFQLAAKGGQVIVSTHSPFFVTGTNFETVRLVRRRPATHDSTISAVTLGALRDMLGELPQFEADKIGATKAKLAQALQPALSEMFFAPFIVFVEGLEDVAYVTSYLTITGQIDEFRRLGCHLVPASGKSSLLQPLAVAKLLGIPHFVVFDSDADEGDEARRKKHEGDNRAILRLAGHGDENPMPDETLWTDNLVMWKSEIGTLVGEDVGGTRYRELRDDVRTKYNMHGKGNLNKHNLLIGYVLAEAEERGWKSPTLANLTGRILACAKTAAAAVSETAEANDDDDGGAAVGA